MFKKAFVFSIVCLLAITTVFAGGSSESSESGEKNFNIDLATAYAGGGPAAKGLEKFVADVKEKSGGSININLFTDGTLGQPNDNYISVSAGDLDMTMSGLEGLDLYAPEYTFLDCPFFIESWDQLDILLDGEIGDSLKARYEENGIKTLAWHRRDIRMLASNKEVIDPSDVKALKLRLPGQQVYVDAWSKLGVTTTTVAMNELYTALQTNIAEACEGGYEQMVTLKMYEVQKYIAESEHVYEFVGLFINKALFDSMSENQQQILLECAEEAMEYADQLSADARETYKQTCLSNGMTFVEIDREAFRAALEPHYRDQFAKKWTVADYDQVMSYLE